MQDRQQLAVAIEIYGKLADIWKAGWIRPKSAALRTALHAKNLPKSEAGRAVPLVFGISKYGHQDPDFPDLDYAHLDAIGFTDYLKRVEPGIDRAQTLFVDQQATRAAIETQLRNLSRRAPNGGTAVLFFSGHGFKDDNGSYIKVYDAHAGDGQDSALPIEFLLSNLENFSRVYAFFDACRTKDTSNAIHQAVRAAAHKGRMAIFMSTQPGLSSVEYREPKGPANREGHGAFTYCLLKSLYEPSGPAQPISVASLLRKLEEEMKKLGVSQLPAQSGELDVREILDPLRVIPTIPAISLLRSPLIRNAAYYPQQPGQLTTTTLQELRGDLSAGTITAESAGRAMRLYRGLSADNRSLVRDTISVALEDAGQRLLLDYLDGEEKEPTAQEFLDASTYYQAAAELAPDSPLLNARIAFNRGRARLFDLLREYDPARRSQILADSLALLDTAYREDPGPYVLNALGIAFLEGGDPARASGAFRDAIKIAPQWLYPRHNLALSLMRSGKANEAIAAYQMAIGKTPGAFSLHFNLALLYQQINQLKNAQAEYDRAQQILDSTPYAGANALARLYNARGTLAAQRNDKRHAQEWYQKARVFGLKEAVHNLALLSPPAEKEELLRENVLTSGYLNSRIELAAFLVKTGRNGEAIPQYEAIVQERPDFAAAHIELARLYLWRSAADSNYVSRAAAEIQKAETIDNGYWSLYLAKAEAAKAQGHPTDSAVFYREARRRAPNSTARREIRESEKKR